MKNISFLIGKMRFIFCSTFDKGTAFGRANSRPKVMFNPSFSFNFSQARRTAKSNDLILLKTKVKS